jgi:hypothetical protein
MENFTSRADGEEKQVALFALIDTQLALSLGKHKYCRIASIKGERVAFSLLQMQISLVFHECAAHAKCKQRQHATQTVALCYLFPHTAQSSLHASVHNVELSSR